MADILPGILASIGWQDMLRDVKFKIDILGPVFMSKDLTEYYGWHTGKFNIPPQVCITITNGTYAIFIDSKYL